MALTNGMEVAGKATREKKDPATNDDLGLRPSRFRVAEKLYQHVKAQRTDRPQTRVYASGLKNCARQQAMAIMGFAKAESEMQQANPHWNVVADFGTALHDLIEGWLKKLGIAIKSEFRVTSPDGALSGRVDHHIRLTEVDPKVKAFQEMAELFPPDPDTVTTVEVQMSAHDAILDVKTVSDKDFKLGAHGPKMQGYVAQISVYGRILGIETGVILLVNRGTGEMLDLEFDIDPVYADKMLRRAKGIVDWAAERRLPPAEEWAGEDGSFYCKSFCPFYRQCTVEQQSAFLMDHENGRPYGKIQAALNGGIEPKDL